MAVIFNTEHANNVIRMYWNLCLAISESCKDTICKV